MSPFVKKLSVELGKTEEEINEVWVESKKLTAETFGIDEADFTKREIMYTEEIVRDAFGLHREITVADFIGSEKSARDFIDEAVQSSDSFNITKSITKKKDMSDEDEKKVKTTKKDEETDEKIEE